MRESVIDQEIWQEWFQEGVEQGLEQKAQEIARNMLSKGFRSALIVEFTDLTVEQIQKLQAQIENIAIQ
ncbi:MULTISPECIES: hypothetical protein [unclassified Anabaena]|uniref:hypothetical protein n=1 Tax=unclassified Anabaena TaxID=2619674 RepID=UPI002B1EB5BB|nr:hypothetical protein [Anabaena sp. UHCC 0399]MEA5564803.1 hypothetical protein [Anabaena sp. UHCC 0399]